MFPNQFAHFLGVFVVAAWKRFTANSIRFTRTITSAENSIDGLDCVLMTECHKNWTAVQQQHHYIYLSLICFLLVFFVLNTD